ncbi:MAG: alpha/beta hydrolase [Myxococcota bacterium]
MEHADAASAQRGPWHHPECDEGSRGELLDLDLLAVYSRWGLERYYDSWLNGLSALGYIDDVVDPQVQNGATVWEMKYCTVDFDGSPIEATGMMALPIAWWPTSTVLYSHGTSVYRYDTVSNPDVDETFDGPTPMVIFAGGGYAYLAPDLTGFGDGDSPYHRYFHRDTAADNTMDMLIAAEDSILYRLATDGRVFSAGFSQGGQTALAFGAEAEALGVDLQATAMVGGVLDPEPWFDWLLDLEDSSYLTLYGADLVVNYERIYGDVYDDTDDAFSATYADDVEALFDMSYTYVEVVDAMAPSMAELTTPDFYAELDDPDSTMRQHLRDNAVTDVCLSSPIQAWHMIDDDEVPFELGAAWASELEGCNDYTFTEWEDTDHLNTWHQVLPQMRDWFDTF